MDDKMKSKWTFRAEGKEEQVPPFFGDFRIPDGLARILMRRGITTADALSHFLYDDLTSLSDPFLMKGMKEGVARILQALQAREKMVIYGDYDVDGITSTSILVRCLKGMGGDVGYYIPSRDHEGYGLNAEALRKLAGEGYTLLITVDCGISSAALIADAPEGLDIIVTDHHVPPEILPDCVAVINPHQKDCGYPYKELAGCGVAFTLQRALHLEKFRSDCFDNVELAALGTIADVVSLTGENRVLVREGMKRFMTTRIKGLSALLMAAGLVHEDTQAIIHADQVSFGLAPRLNAAGRIAHASEGVKLMTTNSAEEAQRLAAWLCDTNVERQSIEKDIYAEALDRIGELHLENDMALVVDGHDWHPGVIGIVASRILELYHRPTLILSIRDGVGKGSCRSIPAFNMYEALAAQKDLLLQYGGHKMAAGFSIAEKDIPEFRRRLNAYARERLTEEDCVPVLEVEEALPLPEVTLDFIRSLDLLEPCGQDNPKPLFASRGVFVETARRIGQDQRHFKCQVQNGTGLTDAIFWGVGEKDPCHAGDVVDLVYEPEIHEWYGPHVQLICKDVREEEQRFLDRPLLVEVYKNLMGFIARSPKPVREVHEYMARQCSYPPAVLGMALAVFEELSLISRFTRNGDDFYQRRPVSGKMDLMSSAVYRRHKK